MKSTNTDSHKIKKDASKLREKCKIATAAIPNQMAVKPKKVCIMQELTWDGQYLEIEQVMLSLDESSGSECLKKTSGNIKEKVIFWKVMIR